MRSLMSKLPNLKHKEIIVSKLNDLSDRGRNSTKLFHFEFTLDELSVQDE